MYAAEVPQGAEVLTKPGWYPTDTLVTLFMMGYMHGKWTQSNGTGSTLGTSVSYVVDGSCCIIPAASAYQVNR